MSTADISREDLRMLFTPPEMLNEDGSINQEYFRPKKALNRKEEWAESDDDLLLQAIAQYGVGEWQLMSDELLPLWEPYELREKAARMFGCFKVSEEYAGWKGEKEAVEAIFKENKQLGLAEGTWHPKYRMRMPTKVPFCRQ